MADEQLDPTQPAAPASSTPDSTPPGVQEPAPDAPAPVSEASSVPAAPVASGPEVTPDPTPGSTPSTSPDVPAPTTGDPVPVAQPVVVNNYTVRSDDDALLGSWVDVIGGPNQGRFGSYVDTVHHDPETGYPSVILIRSRDARNELLEVEYSDVRPSERTGGR